MSKTEVGQNTTLVGRITKLLADSIDTTRYILSFGKFKMASPVGPKKDVKSVEKMCHNNMTSHVEHMTSDIPCQQPGFGPILSYLKCKYSFLNP